MDRADFSYLVACHANPDAVLRLVRRIRALSPRSHVLVRYDVPGLFAPGAVEAAGGAPYESVVSVRWGDWSLVEMQLDLFAAARRLVPAERYVLISGQDYPIRALDVWEQEIVAEGADAFLDLMPPQPRNFELTWRIVAEPEWLTPFGSRVARAVLSRLEALTGGRSEIYPVTTRGRVRWMVGLPRRSAVPAPILKAASWMTLGAEAVDTVLDAAGEGEIQSFFRTVRNPDEFYTPSLLAASGLTVRDRPTTANRFAPRAANPDWVDLPLLQELSGGPAAFVRKIGPDVDPAVLVAADAAADAEHVGRLGGYPTRVSETRDAIVSL